MARFANLTVCGLCSRHILVKKPRGRENEKTGVSLGKLWTQRNGYKNKQMPIEKPNAQPLPKQKKTKQPPISCLHVNPFIHYRQTQKPTPSLSPPQSATVGT
jgi:hypothetical protein